MTNAEAKRLGYKANPAPHIQPHGTLPHLRVSHSKLHTVLFSASFRLHAVYCLCKSTSLQSICKTKCESVKRNGTMNGMWKWIVEQMQMDVRNRNLVATGIQEQLQEVNENSWLWSTSMFAANLRHTVWRSYLQRSVSRLFSKVHSAIYALLAVVSFRKTCSSEICIDGPYDRRIIHNVSIASLARCHVL